MLSVPETKIPRKISIKVARAEKLNEYIIKDGKKKVNNKFKAIILGGKKKESSSTETSSSGNVQWSFTSVIKLHRSQTDPLVILIEDSDGHQKGQVIIPIIKIPPKPYTFSPNQDPATSNNILCSELEPSKKCSDPSGFLLYWIWIEEYYTDGDGDSGKKSFNKSMSSLFGSKSKLGSSKTNLEIKNPDSVSNYSSVTSLNKPQKHKKTSSLLKLKIGKKKSKPTMSDTKVTPDSSDVETSSNFSFNQGNPFENYDNVTKHGRSASQHKSSGEMDNYNPYNSHPAITLQNYTNDPNQRSEILSLGSPDSYSDLQSNVKPGYVTSQISNSIMPIVMPPYENTHTNSDNSSRIRQENITSPANFSDKYKTMNYQDLSNHGDNSIISKVPISNNSNEVDSNIRKGHNKSSIGSDYSIFSERGFEPHLPTISKISNDELENIRKENTDLKTQITKCNHQIYDLEKELEHTKQILCKLRSKLLEEGALKFLEI